MFFQQGNTIAKLQGFMAQQENPPAQAGSSRGLSGPRVLSALWLRADDHAHRQVQEIFDVNLLVESDSDLMDELDKIPAAYNRAGHQCRLARISRQRQDTARLDVDVSAMQYRDAATAEIPRMHKHVALLGHLMHDSQLDVAPPIAEARISPALIAVSRRSIELIEQPVDHRRGYAERTDDVTCVRTHGFSPDHSKPPKSPC